MCGINGAFAYASAGPVDADELVRTRDQMSARGPDGAGLWLNTDRSVGFGHRRLSIIDLTDAAAQPMASEDGLCVVTFNGEIYNYLELRRELEAKGRVFRTASDTEVLLHLYAVKGAEMVHDLRGMFAFAIWDADRAQVFLARDPYGIKPLYYADDGRTLRFASQVKALIAGGGVDASLDPGGWVSFYIFGHVVEPLTIARAIRALPAGCTMTCDAQGCSAPKRYHSVALVYADATARRVEMSDGEHREAAREALLDSVRHHLVADVPVGAFLSAGIDSGALVGLMRDAGQRDIVTVTLRFAEADGAVEDESQLAVEVARNYATRHSTRTVTAGEFKDDLPRILAAMDQPSIDGINTWFVAKAGRELGLKVAISGLGGDELFGGYPSFRDIPRWVGQLKVPARAGLLGPRLRRLAQALRAERLVSSPKALALLEHGATFEGAYLARRGLFMPWELGSELDEDVVAAGLARLDAVAHVAAALDPDPGTDFARVAAMESALYMRNQLLRDTDWASMAQSLEVRVPLVDATLLRRLAEIGRPTKADGIAGAKQLLADAPTVPLPQAVLRRSKTGFDIPVEHWASVETKQAATGGRRLRSRGWARIVAAHFASPDFDNGGSNPSEPKRKLRILMLVSDAHGGFGGIARHNCDVIESLAESAAIEEVVVLPRVLHNAPGPLPAKVVYDCASAQGAASFVARSLVHGLIGARKFDVIHCGHINLMPLASLIGRVRGVPVSLVIHGIDAWQPVHNVAARRTARGASLVISVSALTLGRFRAWSGVPETASLVIPNTVESNVFVPGPKDPRLVEALALEGRKVIMSLGRMASEERQKGFDEVIAAMPALLASDSNIVFLACGDGEDRPRLEAKARALGVDHAVRFPGRISEAAKPAYYRLADAFVMPSSGEGFGIVLLEALSCGIPVVASTLDGTREALRDGMLGLVVDPRDKAALEGAIMAAIARPKAVPNGIEYFSRSLFAERWTAAMTRVAARTEVRA